MHCTSSENKKTFTDPECQITTRDIRHLKSKRLSIICTQRKPYLVALFRPRPGRTARTALRAVRSGISGIVIHRGGKNILFSGTATKSGKIFGELSTQILYNLN
jgi:hypothetical protein